MKSDQLVQIEAPGLPNEPKLMFDPKHSRAIISTRHPTWQSHEWAILTTELLVWMTTGIFLYFIYPVFSSIHIFPRCMIMFFVFGFSYHLIWYLFHRSLRYFLAKRVFATKTTFWFDPKAIIFQSRLYEKPVIIWRHYQSLPVKISLILQTDRDAYLNGKFNRHVPCEHLHESVMLEVMLSTVAGHSDPYHRGQETILRTIPITEINSIYATKLTMVYKAAVLLTASPVHPSSHEPGNDIDTDL